MINDENETQYLYHPDSRELYAQELESTKRCLQSRNIRALIDAHQFQNETDPTTLRLQKHMAICSVCQKTYDREIELRRFIGQLIPTELADKEQKTKDLKSIEDLLLKYNYYYPFWSIQSWQKKLSITGLFLGDILSIFTTKKFIAGLLLATFSYAFLKLVNF